MCEEKKGTPELTHVWHFIEPRTGHDYQRNAVRIILSWEQWCQYFISKRPNLDHIAEKKVQGIKEKP